MTDFTSIERKCKTCGKEFIARENWVYKRVDRNRCYKWFCSWSCLKKFDEKHKGKKRHFVRRNKDV